MHYIQLVTAASLAAIAALACSESETPSNPSIDPTLVTTAAVIPCIGVPADSDNTAYGEKRVFLEAQGWWGERRANGTVPRYGNAEHIHVGMCFPLQQTVSGTKPMRVRVMGHKLPVGSVIRKTNLHDPDGGNFATISWNYTVTAADSGDVELWQTASINTALAGHESGLREFRILTTVERPDGAEIHASSGWCWQVANGGANVDSGTCVDTPNSTMARGWYDCFEYKIAETRNWGYPYSGITRNSSYSLQIGARDGASPANNDFTAWEVRWNPDFHNQMNGSVLASGTGPALGVSVPIPTSTAGVHKLVVIGFVNGECAQHDGELSAVFAVPIKVN